MKIVKEAARRVYNFIVGPRLIGGIYAIDSPNGSPQPGAAPHEDKWVLRLGFDVWIDSAPGFHFDDIGMEVRALWFGLFLAWVDNTV